MRDNSLCLPYPVSSQHLSICIQMLSSPLETMETGLMSTHRTPFQINHAHKVPVFKYSHILRYWALYEFGGSRPNQFSCLLFCLQTAVCGSIPCPLMECHYFIPLIIAATGYILSHYCQLSEDVDSFENPMKPGVHFHLRSFMCNLGTIKVLDNYPWSLHYNISSPTNPVLTFNFRFF